jgi:hypothetical protein
VRGIIFGEARSNGRRALGALALGLSALVTACTPAELRAFFDRHGIEHPSNRRVNALVAALNAFEDSARAASSAGTSRAAGAPTPAKKATGFDSQIASVSTKRLGNSWRKGCPVGAKDLRLVTVDYWGFDGKVHDGEIIVHRSMTNSTIEGFRALYEGRFPIAQMRTAEQFIKPSQVGPGHTIKPSADKAASNNTVGFVCRKITGGTGWSVHAYG